MKKYIALLAALVFPYLTTIMIKMMPENSMNEAIISSTADHILFGILLAYLVCFAGIIFSIIKLKNEKEDNFKYSIMLLAIKILQIPFYLYYFFIASVLVVALTAFCGIGIFLAPIFIAIDYGVLMLSSIPSIACAINAKQEKTISFGKMIFVIISQLVFCVDIIGAILLVVQIKNNQKKFKNNL